MMAYPRVEDVTDTLDSLKLENGVHGASKTSPSDPSNKSPNSSINQDLEGAAASEESCAQGTVVYTHDMFSHTLGAEGNRDKSSITLDYLPKLEPKEESPEHPEGPEIRRQVEYYFSDENLVTDRHLIEKMGGSENKPVALSSILGWKKMRKFKPKTQVIASLRKCPSLVLLDNKYIQRKVPFYEGDHFVKPEHTEDTRLPENSELTPKEKAEDKQKKDKIQPLASKTPQASASLTLKKPTGFETNWTDGPITPAEHEEDEILYCGGPVGERMELAIQRFRAKRTFNPKLTTIFDAFMRYGGVETQQRQWTNVGKEIKDMDIFNRVRLQSINSIPEDRDDPTKWRVDFVGVAAGFISYSICTTIDFSAQDIADISKVLVSFYNHLLHHNVVPEYTDDILAARHLAGNVAPPEFVAVDALILLLPGDFNKSAGFLFGGTHEASGSWDGEVHVPDDSLDAKVSLARAKVAVVSAVTALGNDDLVNIVMEMAAKAGANREEWRRRVGVKFKDVVGLEIVAIEQASSETKKLYRALGRDNDIEAKPVGRMRVKPWRLERFEKYDVPKTYKFPEQRLPKEFEVWFEEDILRLAKVGMKMTADLRLLEVCEGDSNAQLWQVEDVTAVYCSFHRCLLNELMLEKWDKVKWLKKEKNEAGESEGEGDESGHEGLDGCNFEIE